MNINEWEAITQLKSDSNLIIIEEDKGGVCVIMDKSYYKDKILSPFSDKKPTKKYAAPTLEKKN